MGKSKALVLGLIGALLISIALLGGCVPTEAPPEEGGNNWTLVIFMVLIFAVFYFLLIRPQRKKQKEHQQLVAELQRGDRVVTAGGIHGVIESIAEDSIVIKVESGMTLRIARGSVALKQER